MTEFGLVFPQTSEVMREVLTTVIEDASNEIAGLARLVIERARTQWKELDEHIQWRDERIAAHLLQDEQAKQASRPMGICPVGASATVATVGDFKQFKNGAQFGAWLGLTPKQNSSGGKNNLGSITKHGDTYVRMLLIQGTKAAVHTAHLRDDPISKWVHQLREKSGWQTAAVALANKNARILWAMFVRGKPFDPHHVSIKPGTPAPAVMP